MCFCVFWFLGSYCSIIISLAYMFFQTFTEQLRTAAEEPEQKDIPMELQEDVEKDLQHVVQKTEEKDVQKLAEQAAWVG